MAKEVRFVREVLIDMNVEITGASPAVTDSKSAMDTIANPGATKHTVHFERWLHYAREAHIAGWLNVYLCSTLIMWADDKTKPLDRAKGLKCRDFQTNSVSEKNE